MAEIMVDCRVANCPIPLVETMKAIRKASPGDIIEVVGTYPVSKKEIPMAMEAMRLELLGITQEEAPGDRVSLGVGRTGRHDGAL